MSQPSSSSSQDQLPIAPMPQPPQVGRVRAIDVSHYEPRLDWKKAKLGGVMKMYTKASEGVSHKDKLLQVHVNDAQGAGVLCGAYHFFHEEFDGLDQAHFYLNAIKGMRLELPHCLDWESSSGDGRDEALLWLRSIEAATGVRPIIYSGYAHIKELVLSEEFSKYPLWMAHYGISEKQLKIPAPWRSLFGWQYTDHEGPPIIQGLAAGHTVDANWFY